MSELRRRKRRLAMLECHASEKEMLYMNNIYAARLSVMEYYSKVRGTLHR